jgi:hypothetical protein
MAARRPATRPLTRRGRLLCRHAFPSLLPLSLSEDARCRH